MKECIIAGTDFFLLLLDVVMQSAPTYMQDSLNEAVSICTLPMARSHPSILSSWLFGKLTVNGYRRIFGQVYGCICKGNLNLIGPQCVVQFVCQNATQNCLGVRS